jgi:membrane protein YqaA with SNARE-associated domain
VDRFGWAELIALLTSIGFGTVSAVVPVVNAEAYVIASQLSAVIGPIPIAIGIAIGQTVGKLLLFFGVRQGKELPFIKHRREVRQQRPVGPARARFRAAMAKLLDLVGQERWGLPIVLVAAIVGIPPLYAVALLAGATTMSPVWFGLTVLVGRLCRFLLVATGFYGLHEWFLSF